MAKVTTYRDLAVWQKAIEFAEDVYRRSAKRPGEEKYGLRSQLQRSVVSVAANIAEGHARSHRGDCMHHLSVARGSLAEAETDLTLVVRLKLVARTEVVPIWEQAQEAGRMLNGLMSALRRKP